MGSEFININNYLQMLQNAILMKNGTETALLLSFKDPHVKSSALLLEHPEGIIQKYIDSSFDEVIAAHLRCCWSVNQQDFIQAYQYQAILVQAFLKIFQSQKEENWALPILYVIAVDLRVFASYADSQLIKLGRGKPDEALEKAADILMSCFRICAADKCLLLKTHQIPVAAFLTVLKLMQVPDIDQEETNCIIANLIYEGKIKGYLSYQHQKLVISKQNAFPPLSNYNSV